MTLTQSDYAFAVCTVLGMAAAVPGAAAARPEARDEPAWSRDLASIKRPPGMSRGEWRAAQGTPGRVAYPAIDTLQRPALSIARRIGLLTLRGYILFAIVIMAIKLVQYATARY